MPAFTGTLILNGRRYLLANRGYSPLLVFPAPVSIPVGGLPILEWLRAASLANMHPACWLFCAQL